MSEDVRQPSSGYRFWRVPSSVAAEPLKPAILVGEMMQPPSRSGGLFADGYPASAHNAIHPDTAGAGFAHLVIVIFLNHHATGWRTTFNDPLLHPRTLLVDPSPTRAYLDANLSFGRHA
jgi:hypothetical protein